MEGGAIYKLITPADAIVSVAEAKAHLNLEHAEDDALIERLIAAATHYVEKRTARQFGPALWRLSLDGFPSGVIELRKCPVIEVESVTYLDSHALPQEYTDYQLDLDSEPARIAPAAGTAWPTTQAGLLNSVQIEFTAGYGDLTESSLSLSLATPEIPEEVIQVVLLLVSHWYEQRSGVVVGSISKPLEFAVEALTDGLRWTL